jgi:hypothetical protein
MGLHGPLQGSIYLGLCFFTMTAYEVLKDVCHIMSDKTIFVKVEIFDAGAYKVK